MVVTKLTYLTFFCIIIITSLILIYLSKERVKTNETLLYRIMCYSNLICLILQFGVSQISYYYNILSKGVADFIIKLYIFMLVFYALLILCYLIDLIMKNSKKIMFTISMIYIFLSLIIFILPIELHIDTNNKIFYSYGLASNYASILSIIVSTVIIILMFMNIKKLKQKKVIPLLLYLSMCFIALLIQRINPEIMIICFVETYLCFIMYHTIENPDMKMVKQLNIAREQADKANNAKSEFLSSMSHEIRTPLNAIVGFSQALSEEDIPDSAKEEVKDIMSASESLLELVNGILDISKIEANKLEIINNDYRPKEMLHDLVELTKARMGDKKLDLRIKFDETIPDVLYGDKTRVKQIILNLLTNSVKYTKEGFIEFKVNSVIKGNVCRLIVSVEDSGIGIKKENINKLFTKFERLDEQDNVTIEGTGLGLAITKRLIELMNGKIVVQSDYGVGSKFTVSIDQRIVKMKEENVEVKEVVNEESYSDFSDKHILLVDDNMLNLKVAERLLKNYNVNVKSLNNGFDAIDIINNGEKFDLILMDDMMPKLSGVETFKKLKENSNFSIPTVILTANAIEGMKDKYLKEGFDDYLSKPIVKEELNRVLNKFLKESK